MLLLSFRGFRILQLPANSGYISLDLADAAGGGGASAVRNAPTEPDFAKCMELSFIRLNRFSSELTITYQNFWKL